MDLLDPQYQQYLKPIAKKRYSKSRGGEESNVPAQRRWSPQHAILAVAVLWMGVYPKPFTDVMNASVTQLLQHVATGKLPL